MLRLKRGDLIAVRSQSDEKFYYALVLDKIALFGGNWTFVFHRTSSRVILSPEEVLQEAAGFNAFVDFIWAKREDRISRLLQDVDVTPFYGPGFLKNTVTLSGKAKLWFIYNMKFMELRQVRKLSREERKYPLEQRIDDLIMADRVDKGWTPEQDPRI